jgi:hypothetical protein
MNDRPKGADKRSVSRALLNGRQWLGHDAYMTHQ